MTVVFSEVHYVKALTLTMSFLWVGNPSKKKSTLLLVSDANSMTLYWYRKKLKSVPDVDWVVAVLYVTFFSIVVPRAVSLFTVKRCWALLVTGKMHDPGSVKVV